VLLYGEELPRLAAGLIEQMLSQFRGRYGEVSNDELYRAGLLEPPPGVTPALKVVGDAGVFFVVLDGMNKRMCEAFLASRDLARLRVEVFIRHLHTKSVARECAVNPATEYLPLVGRRIPGPNQVILTPWPVHASRLFPTRGQVGSVPPPRVERRPPPMDPLASIRDSENCVGADLVVRLPTGTAIKSAQGSQLAGRYYQRYAQAAAVIVAVPDEGVRQRLIARVRRAAAARQEESLFNVALYDVERAYAIHDATRMLIRRALEEMAPDTFEEFFARAKHGLSIVDMAELVLAAVIDIAIERTNVIEKIVDKVLANPQISAECALNSLVKQGLMEAKARR
jgi:hypothetical protein